MDNNFKHDTLTRRPGISIAHRKTPGASPGVMFCGGFRSDMQGDKATRLENDCIAAGRGYVRFDYRGHGLSSDTFENGCLGDWLEDAVEVFDNLTTGAQVIVGSSMGGWIALLLALKRKERIKALVLIAPAPDFITEVWTHVFTDADRKMVEDTGTGYLPNAYGAPHPMSRRLFEDGKRHNLLHAPIDITCPVRILHSKLDDAVPWEKSERIRACLTSTDVEITYLEDGDHRLSRPQDLDLLGRTVAGLL